jgi:hypothetical protein
MSRYTAQVSVCTPKCKHPSILTSFFFFFFLKEHKRQTVHCTCNHYTLMFAPLSSSIMLVKIVRPMEMYLSLTAIFAVNTLLSSGLERMSQKCVANHFVLGRYTFQHSVSLTFKSQIVPRILCTVDFGILFGNFSRQFSFNCKLSRLKPINIYEFHVSAR